MSAKLKTYRVGVIHVLHFGIEVEVEARNKREARKLALDHNAEISSGDGYDWDRQELVSVKPLKGGECSEAEGGQ